MRRESKRQYTAARIYDPCGEAKVEKGGWRMPRLSQAMKDVISCEKPRGGASDP